MQEQQLPKLPVLMLKMLKMTLPPPSTAMRPTSSTVKCPPTPNTAMCSTTP